VKGRLGFTLAVAGACLAVRAEAQTIVVGPQASAIATVRGTQVTVPIVADMTGSGGASLGSVVARLNWQPEVLALLGVGAGALGAPTVNADSAAGTLRFAVAGPAGVSGQPVLLTATFAVVGALGATGTLDVTIDEMSRSGTFADLLAIGSTTSAGICVSTGFWGDLDVDGNVFGSDALVIVTDAVGLPITPFTTVNGDVDGDGAVSTRDALIVLSYAVGLDVSAFRVGRLNTGGCPLRNAASVEVRPESVTVAAGDRLPLAALVRDSSGAVIHGTDLVWTSADTGVVKMDARGELVGVAAGATRVFANVAPGVKDSVDVTVSGTRRTWYVDQAAAALNAGVEHGSSSYPFSGIRQALARVSAGDTVVVAPAVYGDSVRITMPLTLVGDSTAAGVTTIRNLTGPGVEVAGLSGGTVRLDRLWIEDSQSGVIVTGSDPSIASLSRVSVARSRTVGISVRGVGRLEMDRVLVSGAVHQGIEADSVPEVQLHAVGVDAISESIGIPYAVRVSHATNFVVESLLVATAGVRVDSTEVATFNGFRALNSHGSAIMASVGTTFVLDSGEIRETVGPDTTAGEDIFRAAVHVIVGSASGTARISDTRFAHNARPAFSVSGGDSALVSMVDVSGSPYVGNAWDWMTAALGGQRRAVIERSVFHDNSDAPVWFWRDTAAMHATLDSSSFSFTRIAAHKTERIDITRTRVSNTQHKSAVFMDSATTVTIDGLEQTGALTDPYDDGGEYPIEINATDSVHIQNLYVHDNPFGGLICRSCRAVQALASQFLRNGQYTGDLEGGFGTLVLDHPGRSRLSGLTVEGGGDVGVWLLLYADGSNTLIEQSEIGGQWAPIITGQVNAAEPEPYDTLVVRRTHLHGRGRAGFGMQVWGVTDLAMDSSLIDSTDVGVQWNRPGRTATLYGNSFFSMGEGALWLDTGTVVVDSNSVAGCAGGGGYAFRMRNASASITRNDLAGCSRGVWLTAGYNSTPTLKVGVRGNTIRRDSLNWGASIEVSGPFDSVGIAGNSILGGRGPGLVLRGDSLGMNRARVDSNTVLGMLGDGIRMTGLIFAPVPMNYNLIADNDTNGLVSEVPVSGRLNTVVRSRLVGVSFNVTASRVFRVGNFQGNGMAALSPGAMLQADSSFWGGVSGPRCDSLVCAGGDGDTVGTGVIVSNWVGSPVDSAPPIPAPPLPAPPIVRAARPAVAPLPVRRAALPVDRPRLPPAATQPRRARP